MYTSPRRKGAPSGSRSSLRADDSLLNPPFAIAAAPGGLANVSRPHSKQCPVHRYPAGFVPETACPKDFVDEILPHSPACIVMHPVKTYQGRLSRIGAGKAVSFGPEGAETR